MAEPTGQEVFGVGFTQTSTTFTIVKADLTGLTASANNRAEQLLAAILLKAQEYLTPVRQETNPDQSITIETPSFGADSLVSRNSTTYRQTTRTVNLQKLDTSLEVDPDDY